MSKRKDSLRSIVIATDLSPRTDRALRRAVQLARAAKARLCVVHVVDDDLPDSVATRLGQSALAEMRRQVADIPEGKALDPDIRVERGHGYKAILECARKARAELIVLGMHRVRPIADLFLGTVPAKVARYGDTPVLVVRNSVHGPYARVVVGADFSPASERAIAAARRVAPDAPLRLVHAYHLPFSGFLRQEGGRLAARQKHERGIAAALCEQVAGRGKAAREGFLEPVVAEGAAVEVVAEAVRSLEAELLVLGTRGHHAIGATALGSLAAGFLNNPPCDVLAVPPPAPKRRAA